MKTKTDFQDELAENLLVIKSVLLRCESQVDAMFAETEEIKSAYGNWSDSTFPNGKVSLFTTQRQLLLLKDKLQAINASFVYGDLAQLVEDSPPDTIPF